jgi:hypothetical protein
MHPPSLLDPPKGDPRRPDDGDRHKRYAEGFGEQAAVRGLRAPARSDQHQRHSARDRQQCDGQVGSHARIVSQSHPIAGAGS